jgi:exodeoxyribonuclease VII large subunit
MLRTAAERWPATQVMVVPIPVQGAVESQICAAVERVSREAKALGIEALVLARGGGSREDLAVFDGEELARCLAQCPVPVVSGLGHEDDTTIADLVADYRAATPTAALVALLPDQAMARQGLLQMRRHLQQVMQLQWQAARRQLQQQKERLMALHPRLLVERHRGSLALQRQLLEALSPQQWLAKGFSLVRDASGQVVRSVDQLEVGATLVVHLSDGTVESMVRQIHPAGDRPQP